MNTPTPDDEKRSGEFETTQWTKVLACRGTSPESEQALRDLCSSYYRPVADFIRYARHRQDDAEDLTQEFFTRLLDGGSIANAERDRGRFRAYLLGAVKHFLADMHDHRQAAKRGGGQTILSLEQPDSLTTSESHAGNDTTITGSIADPNAFPPDAFFDRSWAIDLLERVVANLANEYRASDRELTFQALRPALMGNTPQIDGAGLLGISDGATKVAIHRMRKRFRQLVREEIAKTVESPEDVEPEIGYLLDALGRDLPTSL